MITIFTIPKSFQDPHIKLIQTNAISSWKKLLPECEIILFGDEVGVKEASKEFGIKHIQQIKKNEFGTPLLDFVFQTAKEKATNDILVYINSDIILCQDFIDSINTIKKNKLQLFLISGRRIDVDVAKIIDFSSGKLHGFSGMDYFIFPKNFSHNMPSFAVGVSGWDSWFVYRAKSLKVPIIDATLAITAFHQNHSPRQSKKPSYNTELKRNFKLAGGLMNVLTLREADLILTKIGLEKPKFPKNILSTISLFYPWRIILSIKRIFNK